MPLIVNGARQVGKSYILQEFGQQEFDNYIIVNLEIDKALAEKFDEDLTPAAIPLFGNRTLTTDHTW